MMDFAKLALLETAFIHLKDAKGAPLFDADKKPVGIRVYGPSSTAYAQVEERQIARIQQRRQENDGRAAVQSRDVRIAEAAGDLADLTVEFVGMTYSTAGDKHGRELFVAFYSDPGMVHFTKQVSEGVERTGNFSPA